MRRILLLIAVLAVLLTPSVAGAIPGIPIVICGVGDLKPCSPCDLFTTFKNIIDFVLLGITGPVAAFMIVWAGGTMLVSAGTPALYNQGKKLLQDTLIGVTIILSAWIVTNFLLKALVTGNQADNWYEFSCPAGLSDIVNIETAFPSGAPPAIPPARPAPPSDIHAEYPNAPTSLGATCLSQKYDLCNAIGPNGQAYACGSCPAYENWDDGSGNTSNLFAKFGNARLLESIMVAESSCRIKANSAAAAYGPMQMLVPTAAKHVQECQVYVYKTEGDPPQQVIATNPDGSQQYVNITAGWLMSEVNAEKIICLANAEINALKGACGSDPRNIAAGYNSGPGWCVTSRDCAGMNSCAGGQMKAWECPWDDRAHTVCNTGLNETKGYAPKVAKCAR